MRKHLESLVARFPELLEGWTVRESTDTDYAFRLFVAKTNWVRIAAQLSDEIDYENFKSTVALHQGQVWWDYESSLHEVWSMMHELQKGGERSMRELRLLEEIRDDRSSGHPIAISCPGIFSDLVGAAGGSQTIETLG